MTTIIPITPTLHSGIGILKTLPEKAAYTLRHILSNPGKALQATEKESVAIRQLVYQYEQNPQLLCSNLEVKIQTRMDTLVKIPSKGETVIISCSPIMREDGATYDVAIEISGRYLENDTLFDFYETNIYEIVQGILTLRLEGTPYEY